MFEGKALSLVKETRRILQALALSVPYMEFSCRKESQVLYQLCLFLIPESRLAKRSEHHGV